MKRPSFQFYPADWSANSNLRRCTHEEKGIWIDVMCLLHDQEEYGVVRWSLKEIAQAIGSTVQKVRGLVTKGVFKGADTGAICAPLIYIPRSGRKDGAPVMLIPQQSGPIWFSSRMVEDEYKRVLRGELGGAPKPAPDLSPKGGIGATPKPTPDPSPFTRERGQASRAAPSSSSSSSTKTLVEQAASVPDIPSGETPLDAAALPIDPISARALALAVLLRQRGADLQASNPKVRVWAESGVTDAQALTALEAAQKKRQTDNSQQAIGAGYLDTILKDVTANRARASPRQTAQDKRADTIAELTGRNRNERTNERDITGEAERVT